MKTFVTLFVASCFAIGLAAPAFADDAKPMPHHAKAMKAKSDAPKSPTDMLNAQSLQSAQAGQAFMPAAPK
jgi:hypothetical protein